MLNVCSKIVVPFDDSEPSKKALKAAITLAKQDYRIEIDVIKVVTIPDSIYNYIEFGYDANQLKETQLNAARESLRFVDKNLKTIPNKCRTHLLEGSPANEIIDFVEENNADLIVMGSRGLSGLKELFLGSISHYVVQKAPCPVLIVK